MDMMRDPIPTPIVTTITKTNPNARNGRRTAALADENFRGAPASLLI